MSKDLNGTEIPYGNQCPDCGRKAKLFPYASLCACGYVEQTDEDLEFCSWCGAEIEEDWCCWNCMNGETHQEATK